MIDGKVEIEGFNRSATADIIFPDSLDNGTVLDIGSDKGFFLIEAINRNAKKAVGVEVDKERSKLANEILTDYSDKIKVINKNFINIEINEIFDYVLLLNVIHHQLNPVEFITKAANLCSKQLIVEFPLACHSIDCKNREGSFLKKVYLKILNELRTIKIKMLSFNEPIIIVGNKPYHRVFYFSQKAFCNLFIKQKKIFSRVNFVRSPRKNRMIAFCKIKK